MRDSSSVPNSRISPAIRSRRRQLTTLADEPTRISTFVPGGTAASSPDQVNENEQVRASRITAVVLGVFAIGLGILAAEQNIAFLVALAFAVAAAATCRRFCIR